MADNIHMKQQVIYIVEQGENYEGVSRSSLHLTLEGARNQATSWIAAEEAWRSHNDRLKWREEEADGCLYQWQGGCDWMTISEKEILD